MRGPCGLTAMGCVCSCSSGVKCSVFSVQCSGTEGVWSPALACMLCHPKERDDTPHTGPVSQERGEICVRSRACMCSLSPPPTPTPPLPNTHTHTRTHTEIHTHSHT